MKQGEKVAKGLALVLLGAFGIVLSMSPAFADSITFDLTVPNTAGYTGPYVTVTINRTSTTDATVTFTSKTVGAITYYMGDGGTLAANVNATTFTVGAITGVTQDNPPENVLPDLTVANPPGTQNADGFGKFNLVIDNKDGFTQSVKSLTVAVTDTSGTWATASDVLALNSHNALAASHIFPSDLATNRNAFTFYAAGNTGGPEPPPQASEPGTMLLLGSGFTGLVVCRRLRSRASRR